MRPIFQIVFAAFVLVLSLSSCSKETLRLNEVYNDLIINSEADIPNLKKNTRITGNLILEFAPDEQVDLSSLQNVVEIGRNLIVRDGVTDAHLQHLANLTSVFSLEINDNQMLSSLAPLANVDIENSFSIIGCALSEIPVFVNVQQLEGDLEIMSSPNIVDFEDKFPSLTAVDNDIKILFNDGLEVIRFSKLAEAQEISITGHAELARVELPALNEVRDLLSINNAGKLQDLSEIEKVQKIGRLIVQNNPWLVDLNDGTQLELVELAWIRNNGQLDDFCMLQQAAIIGTIYDYDVQGNQYNPSLNALATACSE